MAKVIEFYAPKNSRSSLVPACPPQPGRLIGFSSQAKKSVQTRPARGVLAWLLETTEPNRVVRSDE